MKKTLLLFFIAFLVGWASGCAPVNHSEDRSAPIPPAPKGTAAVDATKATPEPAQYVVDIGDEINVAVFQHDELSFQEKVNSSGIVVFPLVGDVLVKGKDVLGLRQELTAKYTRYLVHPEVIVRITKSSSQNFMVVGEVRTPGLFTLDGSYSVSEALAKAGGLTDDGQINKVLLIRRGPQGSDVRRIAFNSDYSTMESSVDTGLQSGDIVYVPQKGLSVSARFMEYLGRMAGAIVSLENAFVLWPKMVDALENKSDQTSIIIGR